MNQYQSENITDLAKALLCVQRTVQPATKDAENPFTKSWYASLNSVMDACRDALIENGIWLCQYPVPVEPPNSLGLVTKLTHAQEGQHHRYRPATVAGTGLPAQRQYGSCGPRPESY